MGTLATVNGERQLNQSSIEATSAASNTVQPLFMPVRSVGGASLSAGGVVTGVEVHSSPPDHAGLHRTPASAAGEGAGREVDVGVEQRVGQEVLQQRPADPGAELLAGKRAVEVHM